MAAAAATALADGMTVGVELSPRFLVSGGVMALPTRRYCPPRSNRFIELIASCIDKLIFSHNNTKLREVP